MMKATSPDTSRSRFAIAVVIALGLGLSALAACTSEVPTRSMDSGTSSGLPPMGATGVGGATGTSTTDASGATSTTGIVAAGGTATVGTGGTTTVVPPTPEECATGVYPNRAPIRRLTTFEYNNTLNALLGVSDSPGNSLPAELYGNGFGNDADSQPVSAFLAEQYGIIAEDVATSLTAQLGTLAPCYSTVTTDTEEACTRSFVESFAPKAYRRPLEQSEIDELVALERTIRAQGQTYDVSLTSVVEAVLQSPDFLYRVELGRPDATDPSITRPTDYEMASRLSYLLWGSMPDDTLMTAAAQGGLSTADAVLQNATWMLDDARSRPMIRFFFDKYLPISALTDLARDTTEYPTFSPNIGALMREETQTFLEYEIFSGSGTWPGALSAPYTFVNETLANYYGIPGVTGDQFQQVTYPDPTHRMGLLTQGAIMTGTTVTNFTNPVRRGVFLLDHVMCVGLPPPPTDLGDIKPPDPYSGATGRERYTLHSQNEVCRGCHSVMDPPGFALENYDAVGLWRDTENDVVIDASGELSFLPAPFTGPMDLVTMISQSELTQACFADTWLSFAAGRILDGGDACSETGIEEAFTASGYNIKQLLRNLTQTDAFLYRPAQEAM